MVASMQHTTRPLIDLGDLSAPQGSVPWCVGVRERARTALKSARTTREEVQAWVTALRENGNYQNLTDREGIPFLTWEALCEEPPPYGFGCSADEVDVLIEAKPLAQRLAADPKVKPLADVGPPTKDEMGQSLQGKDYGNGASYIVRRLKRDAPEIAQALARGEYPSARAAGIAAGIIKVPTALEVAQKAWFKLSDRERADFLEWLYTPNANP